MLPTQNMFKRSRSEIILVTVTYFRAIQCVVCAGNSMGNVPVERIYKPPGSINFSDAIFCHGNIIIPAWCEKELTIFITLNDAIIVPLDCCSGYLGLVRISPLQYNESMDLTIHLRILCTYVYIYTHTKCFKLFFLSIHFKLFFCKLE